MDFNAGAIIPAGRADARRKIIQGKLIWRASARHGESEKSINNAGMIVSRPPVYEAPFVYSLNARMPDEMRPYRTASVIRSAIIRRSISARRHRRSEIASRGCEGDSGCQINWHAVTQ